MLLRLAALAVLAGCPRGDLPTCHAMAVDGGVGGGPNDGVEAVIVAGDDSGNLVEIHDGSQIALLRAPQGGHILLVGAKLRGTTECMLDATGALRDPATNRVLGLDKRSLLLTSTTDGWAVPDGALSSMPNVAVCPTAAATTSVDGNPYSLELTLVDGSTTIATLKATVTPTCPAGDTSCHAECTP